MHKSQKLPLGYIVWQRKEILLNNNYRRRGSRLYVTLTSGHMAQEKRRRHGVGDPSQVVSVQRTTQYQYQEMQNEFSAKAEHSWQKATRLDNKFYSHPS